MNTNEEVLEIDLQELFAVLFRKFWMILLCGVLCAALGYVFNKVNVVPMYESTTSVYVMSKNENSSVTLSDVQLSSQMTQDYVQIITSRTVLEGVIESLGLEDNYSSFAKRVSVTNPSGTRILKIKVTDKSPFMAQTIANEVRIQAAEKIKSVMDIQAINTVDEANYAENPINSNAFKWLVVGGFLGAFACVVVLVMIFLMDDTIKTADDVERYLKLSTLASVPVREEETKKKSRVFRKKSKVINSVEELEDDEEDMEVVEVKAQDQTEGKESK